MILLPGRRSVK